MDNSFEIAKQSQVLGQSFPFERLGSFLLRFLNRLKQTGKSAHTISAYRNDLTLFSSFLSEKKIDPRSAFGNVTEEWAAHLNQNGRRSVASVRRAQMSVRTFMHFLVLEKIIEGSPFLEVKSPKQPRHDLFVISDEHYQKLTSHLLGLAKAGDEKAIRDLALILLLGECGLKASEAAALSWQDLFIENEGGSVCVHGHVERVLKFNKETSEALSMLREVRANLGLSVLPAAKLFFGYMNVSRKTRTDALHRHGIKFIIYEVCEEILGVPYNSESLRNRAIIRMLKQGLTSTQVADLAGYSSLHSLERFTREVRRKARRVPRKKSETEQDGT